MNIKLFTPDQLLEAKKILLEKSKESPKRLSQKDMLLSLRKDIQKLINKGWTHKEIEEAFAEKNISLSLASLKKKTRKSPQIL